MSLGLSGGLFTNLLYVISDALISIRDNIATSVLTSVTIGFALSIFSLFLFVFINLNGAVNSWGDRTQIVVYIKDQAASSGPEKLREALLKVPGVRSAGYISRELAIKELKEELKGHEAVLEGVDSNPLPASFEVKVLDSFRDPQKLLSVVERLKRLEWAEDVQYSQEWVEKFSSALKFIELSALVVGIFLAAATVFIISNTVRLTVYARKEEIEIMRLVGASGLYIRAPFFIEGVVQGLIGSVIAAFFLAAGRHFLLSGIPPYLGFVVRMPFSASGLFGIVVLTGVFMGVVGSLVTMGRFLKI